MSLFSHLKRLAKHSAIYGVGHIITRSLGFLLLPVYTNAFTADAFGVAGLMMTYLTILTLAYLYGLDAGFLRFYIAAESKEEKSRVFSTTFWTLSVSSLLVSTAFWLVSPHLFSLFRSATLDSAAITFLFRLVIAVVFFDTLSFIPLLLLRAEEKSAPYIVFKIGNVIINLAANLFFIFYLRLGVSGIFWANLLSSVFTFITVLPLTIRHLRFSLVRPLLKKMMIFGLPALPAGLAIALIDTIDRIFLERICGLHEVGLYNSGSRLGMAMALFVAAFRFAWPPYFLSVANEADAKNIYSRVFTYMMTACAVVFLSVSLFVDPISRFSVGSYHLIGAEYWSANALVPIILLAYVFYAAYLVFYIGPYLTDKTFWTLRSTLIGAAVNLLANALLVPWWGMYGAAWARCLAYFIMAATLYYFSQRLYPIRFEWSRILRLILVAALLFFLGRRPYLQQQVLVLPLLVAMFPILLYGVGFFHQQELNRLRSLWQRK